VSFLATHDVIRRSAALGANLVITHEPTFYNHFDDTQRLAKDPVYEAKRALAHEHRVVIYRAHDGWHRYPGDPIRLALAESLGWQKYADPEEPEVRVIPETTLAELVAHVKKVLGAPAMRVIGDPALKVRRVAVVPGARNGEDQIAAFERLRVEVLLCGEVREWETTEYVRDAVAQGRPRALVVTGHAVSEELGMKAMAEWLKQRLPGIPVTHVPAGDPFRLG
jgi:putative NIF3 family GTP cyclohydrolase 1 type 2